MLRNVSVYSFFNMLSVWKTMCSNFVVKPEKSNSNLCFTWFDSAPYKRNKKGRKSRVLFFIKIKFSKRSKIFFRIWWMQKVLSLESVLKNTSNIILSWCNKPSIAINNILSMFLKLFNFLASLKVFKRSTMKKNITIVLEISR